MAAPTPTVTPERAVATVLALLLASAVAAQEAIPGEGNGPGRGWKLEVAPPSGLYPHYMADPMRAQSALTVLGMISSDIPDTGGGRFGLRLGGRFAMLRYHPQDNPDVGWQLDLEGGFFGHFDAAHSLDNIGWDGVYGLLLSYRPGPRLAFRFGRLHDSAHIGDEYAERTGRQRIGYTREELVLGVSWQAAPRWRVYGEAGYDPDPKEFQSPFRGQAGVEYSGTRRWYRGRLSWYAALDIRAFEENDWEPRTTAQIGFILPFSRGTGRYRFALEYCDGRSVLGEFFSHDESYVGVGWYFDL